MEKLSEEQQLRTTKIQKEKLIEKVKDAIHIYELGQTRIYRGMNRNHAHRRAIEIIACYFGAEEKEK